MALTETNGGLVMGRDGDCVVEQTGDEVQKRIVDGEIVSVVVKRKKHDAASGKRAKKPRCRPADPTPRLVPGPDPRPAPPGLEEPGSLKVAEEAFSWLVGPTPLDEFYKESWEKKPLLIQRNDPTYFKSLFSTKALDKILREQRVMFGKNLDVTSYSAGQRETHNSQGRVFPAVLWDFYNNGCSVRLLNPQTFHNAVWRLCSTLQDHFGSMVGANVYLTPPGTQGFAPHWDDVEVFMCQLEGRKRWRLYGPREEAERLPRYSSPNFTEDEVGEPILETVLEPGDVLYMPRGTIHQGNCLPEQHSLHITISCYQLHSYTDLLEKLLPAALATAAEEDAEFREGLPRDYLSYTGVAHEDSGSPARPAFLSKVSSLLAKLAASAPVDAACDQLGKRLMAEVLPPALEQGEKSRTVAADGERWHSGKQDVVNRVEIDPDTFVRLVRASACRLVQEEDTVRLYYSTENTREFKEVEEQFLEVGVELAPAVEQLVTAYPAWTKVEDLPADQLEERMKVVGDLWEKGILMTSQPLEAHYEDP